MTRLPVLMYHSIGGPVPAGLEDLAVPPGLLLDQLAALAEAGHPMLGLTEALARPPGDGPPPVALTFDDGYTDFVSAGLPVLQQLGAAATLYVPTRPLGGRARWLPGEGGDLRLLDPPALVDVAAAGIEVGSHGAEHVPMDVLPAAVADQHLHESRARLEDVLGRPVDSFCYPHGYHSRRLRRQARGAGYGNACAIGHRLHGAADDPFAVSRLHVLPSHRPEDLLHLVRSGPSPWVPAAKRVAGPGWRVARRVALRTAGVTWT